MCAWQAREAQAKKLLADIAELSESELISEKESLDEIEDLKHQLAACQAREAPLIDFIKNCYRYDSHDDMWYFDEKWQKSILAEEEGK